MIGQVINITGIQPGSIKAQEAESLLKLLPAENSVVEVSVLDKPGKGVYKLLIEGNVFQSKLPIGANIGETLIAKVISVNPFTLALDNIFPAKMLNNSSIAAVLAKLGLAETEVSVKVLKTFLSEQKPLVKSKLKKIIDLLEKEGIKLDDQQLSLFIQILFPDENKGTFLNKSFAKLFRYPAEDLAAEVLNSVKRLNKMGVPEELISQVNRALVMDMAEGENPDAIALKEKTSPKQEGFFGTLSEMESLSESAKKELSALEEILVRFNMLRACYYRTGVYPGFVIVRSGDELELVEYRLEKGGMQSGQGVHKIKLEMNPGALGKVTIEGFLSGSSLNAVFRSSEETIEKLASNKEELLQSLGRINIQPHLNFGNAEKVSENAVNGVRQINVRL